MVAHLDSWHHFVSVFYWWMHAIVAVWVVFALMAIRGRAAVSAPLAARSRPRSAGTTFALVEPAHRILQTLCLLTLSAP